MVASVENVSVAMLASLSAWHIGIILLAVLILFGGKKLPELARGLGRGLRIFKEEVSGLKGNVTEAMDDEPKPVSKTAEPAAKADKVSENKPAGTNQG